MAAGQNTADSDTLQMSGALDEIVIESAVRGNQLSMSTIEKRETITSAGLKKMACCTLAESFENSASVSVGYDDAVSGTRQIKMLGLAGVYTQFLDESRPFMRGLVSPYALNYTPGDWLRSIQVSKGVTSVTAGHEAITGQINLEYRKPTDDEKLHVNLYLDDMLRPEINLTSAIHFKEDKSLSTIIMAHGSLDTEWREMRAMDKNHDGFRDLPRTRQLDIANRWLWLAPNGMQLRWGAKFTTEDRLGGQLDFEQKQGEQEREEVLRYISDDTSSLPTSFRPMTSYGSRATNHDASTYLKAAMPLRHTVNDNEGGEWQDNVALLVDWNHFDTRSYFGYNQYNAHENSVSLNLRMDHYMAPHSSLALGVQGRMGFMRGAARKITISNNMNGTPTLLLNQQLDERMDEREAGVYAEWNHTLLNRLTMVAGLRADYNDRVEKWMVTPRLHVKWDITPHTILRASGGLGYRTPYAIIENLGVMATGYALRLSQQANGEDYRRMEKALTTGGSLTQTFTLGRDYNTTISLDYFRTYFYRSLIASQEPWPLEFAIYSSSGKNYTNTWQLDFNWTPVERFEVLATMRYTHSRMELPLIDTNLLVPATPNATQTVERALLSKFKGVLNLSYATRFRIWVFDLTGQLNGPSRIPGLGYNTDGSYHSPTYGQLFAQVTHKMGRAEIYAGCENITDYRQKAPIVGADTPFDTGFNSVNVWGPLMGRKFYVGMRWNLY